MGLPVRRGRPDREARPGPGAGQDTAAQGAADREHGEPRLKEMYEKPTVISRGWTSRASADVTTKDVLDIAMALEGLNRQAGMHAAGVVIADKPLWEYVPVYKDAKSETCSSPSSPRTRSRRRAW